LELTKEPAPRLNYSFGAFQLDPTERRLVCDGREVRLPPKVFELLVILVERHGLLVEKDDLMKALWPDMFVEEITLTGNISRLRKALGDAPGQDESLYIETVSKRGYRFIANVAEVAQPREFEVGPIISSTQGNKRSLAVLPFRLLTPDPASEFLSVALADALINQLSSYREIIVRSTDSILRYANRIVDPLLAARELNTHICVEGSIQKVGSRIRVHVQVWDTSSRRSLSSAKHDADDTELFQLQDSMADNVASALGLALKPATGQPPTNNPIAYELFLRAVACLSRYSRWEVRSAITMLEEATRLDAQFASAWSQLAEACMRMFTLFEPDEHWLRQAERAVRRCLTVDPGNAVAYCVRARIQWSPPHFKIRNALRSITKALRLDPGCSQAQFWQGMYLFHVGLHEEANRAVTATLAVNPEDPLAMFGLGHIAMYSWDFETAYRYHSRALATDPSHFYAALFFPGVPLYTGDLNDAEDKIKCARQIAPVNPMVSSWEALLFAKRGDAERAETALRSATRSKQLFTY